MRLTKPKKLTMNETLWARLFMACRMLKTTQRSSMRPDLVRAKAERDRLHAGHVRLLAALGVEDTERVGPGALVRRIIELKRERDEFRKYRDELQLENEALREENVRLRSYQYAQSEPYTVTTTTASSSNPEPVSPPEVDPAKEMPANG